MTLSSERCFNHAAREAVARCPECGRYFCRECVSEHEDRLLCGYCLKMLGVGRSGRRSTSGLVRAAQVLAGFVLLWSAFYLLGRLLLTIPSSFHDRQIAQEEQYSR
jgi:hypothetical protein